MCYNMVNVGDNINKNINLVEDTMPNTQNRYRRQEPSTDDAIVAWRDLRGSLEHAFVNREIPTEDHPTYIHYLDTYHRYFHDGTPLPTMPTALDDIDLEETTARVNTGRWVWICAACGQGYFAERVAHHPHPTHSLAMCVACPETIPGEAPWVDVQFPQNAEEIEGILLQMPVANTHDAPIRNWLPTWDTDRLRDRLVRALDLSTADNPYPRKLSIGTSRVWAVGEFLTAPILQRYISDLIDDLAGRNGLVAFENSIALEPRTSRTTVEGEISYESGGKKFVVNTGISGGAEVRLVHVPDVGVTDGDIICIDSSSEVGYRVLSPGANGTRLTSRGPGLTPVWS